MAGQTLIAPEDYGERARLCLVALPGTDADKARLLDVKPYQVCRWKNGTNTPADPRPIANALDIPPGLIVYGPTERLRVMLAARRQSAAPA